MTVKFFVNNRVRLAENTDNGLIVISAYSQIQRGNDAAFQFEQEANFWWLTGIDAPNWQLIFDSSGGKSWLVMPKVSATHQIFDGSLSATDAKSISGVDKIINQDEALKLLKDLAVTHNVVYTIGDVPHAEHFNFVVNPVPKKTWHMLEHIFTEVQDCRQNIAKLRAIKQPIEIAAIKKAIKLTIEAFETTKASLSEFKTEYEVEAEFTYAFRRSGAIGHAYDPIVASGNNAVTLHYNTNNQKLKSDSLLLLDIGARVDGYAADITRTYAYGEVSNRHRTVHAAVENAHKEIIELLRPGLAVKEYFEKVDVIMVKAIEGLGLIKEKSDYRKYFPHSVSHGLGIDVHDSLGGPETFQPGMVLTVEPGIYIPEEGIGVRIEDDILITENGHENLSADLPTSL